MNELVSCRMYEAECFGMQCLPWKYAETVGDKLFVFRKCCAFYYDVAAVSRVAKKRVLDELQVRSYLMCAPCFKFTLYQSDIAEPL